MKGLERIERFGKDAREAHFQTGNDAWLNLIFF